MGGGGHSSVMGRGVREIAQARNCEYSNPLSGRVETYNIRERIFFCSFFSASSSIAPPRTLI